MTLTFRGWTPAEALKLLVAADKIIKASEKGKP